MLNPYPYLGNQYYGALALANHWRFLDGCPYADPTDPEERPELRRMLLLLGGSAPSPYPPLYWAR